MKKIILFSILLFFFSCSSNKKQSALKVDEKQEVNYHKKYFCKCTPENEFPYHIVQNRLYNFYNEAKWLYYACNFECTFVDDKRNFVNDFQLVEHELVSSEPFISEFYFFYLFPQVGKENVALYSMTSPNCKVLICLDDTYFDRFATKIGVDSVMHRVFSDCGVIPNPETYFAEPEKYKENIEAMLKVGIRPLPEQLKHFENYLKTTTDSLTPWLRCEAKHRRIIK